jgi:hypothetical protein
MISTGDARYIARCARRRDRESSQDSLADVPVLAWLLVKAVSREWRERLRWKEHGYHGSFREMREPEKVG